VRDIERLFIGEHLLLVGASLIIGNILTIIAVRLLSGVQVALTIPWEISAKPHFLVQENAIDRVIKVSLPVSIEWGVLAAESVGFLVIFLVITILMVRRLRRVKPAV
jgi:ABC-type antimicrobial peptide transport system permease subunit